MFGVLAKLSTAFKVDTKWVHILLVTEWTFSHKTKKTHIVNRDVVGLLIGEDVSTKKHTSLQRMWFACFEERK